MVNRKNINKKFALISLYNKASLKYLCNNLHKHGYSFISTGSTSKMIRKAGFDCLEVSEITKFKEILDGRVKTLSSKIYGSILHVRDNKKHINEFSKLNFPKIDIVVINLYPFEKFSKDNENQAIEMIDIGGTSLLRASSKNYKYVTPIADIKDYKKLIKSLNENSGSTDINFRRKMAEKIFKITSNYDDLIYNWLSRNKNKLRKNNLRYGENPDQNSYIISDKNNIFKNQLNGKNLSYNNIIDIDSGLRCLNEFSEPTCVILKHTNPCGVASSNNIDDAFKKAYLSDSKSAFGGIVVLNRKITFKTAKKICEHFFEIIVATDFDNESIKIFKKKKNLILLKLNKIKTPNKEYRSTIFGSIYQKTNNQKINRNFIKLVTNRKISNKLIDDVIFATKVVKHLKSNAVVIANNKKTIGLGMGQTNRIGALKLALRNITKSKLSKKYVCASDGFFPFIDSLEILNKNNCKVIVQPSGSIKDKELINYSKNNNLSLFFMKNRLFKH